MFKSFILLFLATGMVLADANTEDLFKINSLLLNIKNDTAIIQWAPSPNSNNNNYIYHLRVRDSQDIIIHPVSISVNVKYYYTLKNLKSGDTYYYQLCKYEIIKNVGIICTPREKQQEFTTMPNPPSGFTFGSLSENEIIINWLPPSIPCTFNHYQVTVEPLDKGIQLINRERQVVLRNLYPGRLYSITIKTVSNNNATSLPISISYRTKPMPPSTVTINNSSITARSFSISWKDTIVENEFDEYKVSLQKRQLNENDFTFFTSITLGRNVHSWEFENLEPGWVYRAIVQTVSGNTHSQPAHSTDILLESMLF